MAEHPRADDALRHAQHEAIKSELRGDVNRNVAREAHAHLEKERGAVRRLGAELEQRAVREVEGTERDDRRLRTAARIAQFVDFAFFATYAVIGLEIILELTGAREANVFKRMMDALSYPFLIPFRGLFRDPAIGDFRLMFSYVAALVAWVLLHLAIRGLLRVLASRRTTI